MTSAVEPARRMTLDEEAGLLGRVASSDAMADSIARRVYEAETPEEAFGEIEESIEAGLPGLEDMLYEPLIFIDVEYLPSTVKGTRENAVFGVYQVARAKPVKGQKAPSCDWEADGDPFLVSCGARNVVFGLANAKEKGWLPMALCITTKETGSGYTAYWPHLINAKHPLPSAPKAASAPPRNVPVGEAPGDDEPL